MDGCWNDCAQILGNPDHLSVIRVAGSSTRDSIANREAGAVFTDRNDLTGGAVAKRTERVEFVANLVIGVLDPLALQGFENLA
jgi:hypothetical protein